MCKEIPMDFLYRGLGYEYYTASQLWKMGYEAYKMDADFGFDIMAYNQREKTFESSNLEKIYLFQVKMRCDYNVKISSSSAGERKESRMHFSMGEKDYLRLLSEEKGYLVCYFVEKSRDSKETVLGEFWLNNKQLKFLKNHDDNSSVNKYFKQNITKPNKIYIDAIIQTQANPQKLWLEDLSEISNAIELVDGAVNKEAINKIKYRTNKIKQNIVNSSIINKNSNINIYLYCGETKKWLSTKQLEFVNFASDNITENPFH